MGAAIGFMGPVASGLGLSGAAAGAGIWGTLSGMAASPLWGPLMAMGGTSLLERFLSPQTAYEKASGQMMQAGMSILPELQRQAAGLPTAVSKNIIRQVRQAGTRQQQAYATSARRGGMLGQLPGGSTPYRVQQGRIQGDIRQVMGQRLSEAQLAAQGQLAGFAQGGMRAAERQGIYREESGAIMMRSLGRWMQQYSANKGNPRYERAMQIILESINQAGQPAQVAAPARTPAAPAAPVGYDYEPRDAQRAWDY